jgi:hypothetical protein
MSHLHTEPGQHDATVSAYIIRLDTLKPSILLHRHKKVRMYLQFGGHIEFHEDPWDALTHELAEESGYTMDQLQLLQPDFRLKKLSNARLHPVPVSLLTHKFKGIDHYHTDTAFAFVASEPPRGRLAAGESEEFKTFTVTQLRALPDDEIPDNVRETCLFVLEECRHHWKSLPAAGWNQKLATQTLIND